MLERRKHPRLEMHLVGNKPAAVFMVIVKEGEEDKAIFLLICHDIHSLNEALNQCTDLAKAEIQALADFAARSGLPASSEEDMVWFDNPHLAHIVALGFQAQSSKMILMLDQEDTKILPIEPEASETDPEDDDPLATYRMFHSRATGKATS